MEVVVATWMNGGCMIDISNLSTNAKMIAVLLILASIAGYAVGFDQTLPQIALAVVIALSVEIVILRIKYNGKKNPELSQETVITGMIIGLVLAPGASVGAVALAALAAVFSKIFITEGGKNAFNPAAFGLVVSSIIFQEASGWWVSAAPALLLPYGLPIAVILLGAYMVKEAKKLDQSLAYIATLVGIGAIYALMSGQDWYHYVFGINWFFALMMLADPRTSPGTEKGKIFYGVATAALVFVSYFTIPASAELGSLMLANAFVPLINKYVR